MRATRRHPNRVFRLIGGLILLAFVAWTLLSLVTAAYWLINGRV